MSFCGLLAAALFDKVKLCPDCEGWFLESKMRTLTGLCKKCHKWQENKIFDHANKKLRSSTEKTPNLDPTSVQTKNGRYMLKSKCAVCGKTKTRFVKAQEASGLLSMLGVKTPLSMVPGLNLLF